MAKLSLNDLHLLLRDFFDHRLALVQATASWRIYGKRLRNKLDALEALPEVTGRTRPLAQELEDADGLHDDLAAAARLVLEGCLRYPHLDPALQAAAQRLLAFLPELRDLSRSYDDEAANALDRQRRLGPLEPDLR